MSFHNRRKGLAAGIVFGAIALPVAAGANLPAWLEHIVGASTVESALYRTMQLPAVEALYPRPPKEAAGELSRLISAAPSNPELYQLRARTDEQALDQAAAEADWKLYAAHAADPIAAKLELADFYQRRLEIPQEIAILREVAAAPPLAAETYTDPATQRSWRAYERILGAIYLQGLPPAETADTFNAFLTRYPDQPSVYAAAFQFQLEHENWPAAQSLIERYTRQFPQDHVFAIRAQAQLEFRRGNVEAALAVYDHAFQPLWPAELIRSYLNLLERTHRQRAFVAAAREQLAAHPDGNEALNALARIFFYDQQAGRTVAAQQTLDRFRIAREARNGAWTPEDLYTLAALSQTIPSYAEAARYDYALASIAGTLATGEPAAQAGLAGLIRILLEAPTQPLAVVAQNLTLYRDIATLDQGPGYWNGILSLWLNGERPASEYQSETTRAQSYFHRSRAAELLAELDQRFPAAPERATLHFQLISAIAQYGEPALIVSAGKDYLAAFPSAPDRLNVAGLMADAYARQNDTTAEFALYESELNELAAETVGLPLTSSATAPPAPPEPGTVAFEVQVQDPDSVSSDTGAAQQIKSDPLASLPTRRSLPAGSAYAAVLDRYLGRLTATNQLPRALAVLRAQLDRNPNDPQLYERLASFLQQNDLSGQQEQVYQQAIAKFQQPGYYDKLARLYLRERKREAFEALTKQVTGIFSGTDLDRYFESVRPNETIGPQIALELNLYAANRFPHDLVFTRNLLNAYQAKPTRDPAAYEALLRRRWWASAELRDQFLTYLSRTGKLQSELAQLEPMPADDPAARREEAEIDIFTSHFEQAAPLLGSVADLYPADPDVGDQAVSLYRSLAYLDPQPASTLRAVALERNLLAAAPDSPDRLATLGDLYAEATSTGGEDLTAAAPYWRRIPELHPGSTQGFLTAATIFWDYFQFDDALTELTTARNRFQSPALFGYEAGAIEENRHNLSAAVTEYTNAVIHPIAIPRHFDSGLGVIRAWLQPPSDAGDSNLRSTAQSFLGSEEANARLLQLATRPAARASVDAATSRAIEQNPANTAALTLRADVLAAQHHAPELTPLLTTLFTQALNRAATLDEAAAVGALAQTRSLTPVYEQALARQANLTPDPVQKIELEYTLARSLEAHDDLAGSTRIIETIHTADPRLLGVVRATTDFYARTNQPQRAIATLLDAAKVATPSYARDFTLEAASRANDANDTGQARALALGLLSQTPYDARVLDILATSYACAHDDAGLKQFYLAQLDTARKAPGLTADARRQDIALLRRGLIPALTRLNDFPGAVDQYTALLSAFPEDATLGQEAALYALKHSLQSQLLEFLRTTVRQSPRDSRFMVLLAQTETTFGDLPAAEAADTLAITLRKDRADLYTARAEIELRLSQTDPAQAERAAADFDRLYLLSYHDPAWMVRLAELRARQQRPADAVKALETAYISGHARSADDFFNVAAQLERWNLLAEARTFAEQGVTLAGPDLLTAVPEFCCTQQDSGAATYARILVRLGQADQALSTLISARHQAEVNAYSPAVLAAEIAREHVSNDVSAFREQYARRQVQTADQTLRTAVDALGRAVQTYYTPEQRQAFAQTLDKLHQTSPELALEAATVAGLADREADWRRDELRAGSDQAKVSAYVSLEQHRLQFSSLGHDLEAYASRVKTEQRSPIFIQAAQAYRQTGDIADELRLERSLVGEAPQLRERFFALLLRSNRAALTALATNGDSDLADAAVNYLVANGTQAEALAAVARRGQTLDTVWRPASASLVQTYFASSSAGAVDPTNFLASLTYDATIATRLSGAADPKRQLTGDVFFYYASRFGIFLSTVPRSPSLPEPEDFLPAELEDAPSATEPYLNLARSYGEAHSVDAAVTEYTHALELAPSDAAIEDELATTLYRANRHDDALTHWHTALNTLRQMQQHAQYPESWFVSLETVIRHLGVYHLTESFRPEIETILGPYLQKNGTYRSNELLKSVYLASATPQEGSSFILAVASAAPDPNQVLDDLNREPWLSEQARALILERQIALTRNRESGDAADNSLSRYQNQLIQLYLAQNHSVQAQTLYDSLPEKDKRADTKDEIILAVRTHHLEALLDRWRADPDSVPKGSFGSALYRLMKPTPAYTPDLAAIRPLEEFLFTYKRQNNTLVPTDFLSLAQLRLDTGDLPGALDLLQQLTVQPVSTDANGSLGFSEADEPESTPDPPATIHFSAEGKQNPYVNTDYAASLLEHNHHPLEAIPFLQSLARLVPWDASYRLRLAQAELAGNASDQARTDFVAVARNPAAPYDLRVTAARALTPLTSQPVDPGSSELNYLAHPSTLTAARQPYFAAARVTAAGLPATVPADRDSLLREALAISPDSPDAARARLDLLLLQPATADPSATLAILGSIQNPSVAANALLNASMPATPDGSDDTANEAADTQTPDEPDSTPARGAAIDSPDNVVVPPATLPQPASLLDLPARIRLATQLSSASQRDGNLEAALAYAELAVNLASSSPPAELTRRRDDLKTAVLLARRNALRRPALHEQLAQTNQVRPRLTAATLAQEPSQ